MADVIRMIKKHLAKKLSKFTAPPNVKSSKITPETETNSPPLMTITHNEMLIPVVHFRSSPRNNAKINKQQQEYDQLKTVNENSKKKKKLSNSQRVENGLKSL